MAEEMNQNVQPQGWKDVQITPDMALSMIVGFMNVLNQRLATVENIVTVPDIDGKSRSLTEIYAKQAEAEMAAQVKQAEQAEQTEQEKGE